MPRKPYGPDELTVEQAAELLAVTSTPTHGMKLVPEVDPASLDPEPPSDPEELDELHRFRVEGETDDHFEWYVFWQQLKPGHRMRSSVAEHFGVHQDTVNKVAHRYDWKGRSVRWSNAQMSLFLDRQAERKLATVDKLTATAEKILGKLERRIDELTDAQVAQMSSKDVAMLLDSVSTAFKTVHGDKKVLEGDAPRGGGPTFNGPVQFNGGDGTQQVADVRGRLAPYRELLNTLPGVTVTEVPADGELADD